MSAKKNYANGQKIHELTGDKLIYFYKSGKLKAEGPFIKEQMDGEWKFYRETGQLCQVGHFKNGKKTAHGYVMIRMEKKSMTRILKMIK